jgi:hypothetical protein
MNKKLVVLFLAIIIGFLMVSLSYFNNDAKAKIDHDLSIRSIDSDGDFLCDYYEEEIGTNPFDCDSDFDFINDNDEVYLGTSPTFWDTDHDKMADGNEIGERRGSTSPFEKDTDHDGLPDPWEDNDGDGILNREEQLPMHDGIMFYTDPFHDPEHPEQQLAPSPNEADTDGDGWDDGFEIQVNSTFQGSNAVSPAPSVDRQNNDLDISTGSNSWVTRFLSNVAGWDSATFSDWRTGLKLADQYGLVPKGCQNIAWYHFSPYYLWEQQELAQSFHDWKNDTFHGANEQLFGGMDRGGPYRWNKYDCDPGLNDTDGDVMDDNWDPFPLRINLRNGTFAAINSVQRVGGPLIPATAPFNDYYYTSDILNLSFDHFGSNISVLELEKGDLLDINISIGLQECNPQNGTHVNFKDGKYSPTRVIIRFRTIGLGMDGKPHTIDDDLENGSFVARVTRTFTNFDDDHVVPGMREHFFINHLLLNTTITFFYQEFRIRVPSRVPAGHIAITVETDTENNHYYYPSERLMAY